MGGAAAPIPFILNTPNPFILNRPPTKSVHPEQR